jgi:hypothetical protein
MPKPPRVRVRNGVVSWWQGGRRWRVDLGEAEGLRAFARDREEFGYEIFLHAHVPGARLTRALLLGVSTPSRPVLTRRQRRTVQKLGDALVGQLKPRDALVAGQVLRLLASADDPYQVRMWIEHHPQ